MSWQAYVDDHLLCDIEGNHLSAAAIIGQDGSVWAQSSNFPQFKQEEINGIMNDFAEPGSLAPTGLYLGGTKYMVIQGEPGAVIRGKKVTCRCCLEYLIVSWLYSEHLSFKFQGPGGVTVKKTNQALIIGIYDEPMTPGQCNMVVERLGDYLIDQGL
ncbi:hypothetical protein Godav_003840 [Gossypium davidsonii]|uniref:Profilin n=1 Tax=Gossypium davidsonii TaxID=34287 RepID=A0A7J8SJ26_GOSDV|nr:hypothetical protein [Gossypium davidsonii]